MPSAAAAISSLCSAMRLRSRQVSCRIGSMPSWIRIAAAATEPMVRSRAGAVGDVDGIGQALQRRGLGHQVGGVAGNRRRDLGGDDEAVGGELFFQGH